MSDASPVALTQLAATDPDRARRRAIAAAATANEADRVKLLVVAAEASIHVGAVSDALLLFREAADESIRIGDPDAGSILVRLAAMSAASGDSDLARRTLDDAEPLLGDRLWLAWYQRGLIEHWAGRSETALEWLNRAEPAAVAAGDELTVAKLLMNRALVNAYLGELDAAALDAADAETRCRALGELTFAAGSRHNRGWIAARAGDLAGGWRLMHEAAKEPSWAAPPVTLADRAELAHAAGLLAEAAELADDALVAQRAAGDDHGAAITALLRARVALDLGDSESALRLASDAATELSAQGRAALAGAAAAVELAAHRDVVERRAESDQRSAAAGFIDALHGQVAAVEAHPWRNVRIEGLLAAGEISEIAGRNDDGGRFYGRVALDRSDDVPPDVPHLVADALAHRARTGHADPERLDAAWSELTRRRALRSVAELRDDWGASTRLLVRAALVPLLRDGDAEGSIQWLERLRPITPPPDDAELLGTATELRALWRRGRNLSIGGDIDEMSIDDDATAVLEAQLVDRARLVGSTNPAAPPPTAAALADALGDTELRWIIALPSGAWTIALTASHAQIRPIDRDQLEREAVSLTTVMRLGRGDFKEAAAGVDRLLGGEGAESMVVIPVGSAVEDLSFGALPSLARTRLRTCWSGAHWLVTRAPRHVGAVTLAATRVEGSAREVELLSAVWPGASTLVDDAMTSTNIQAALESADLVHIGAHGHLRRDNPMLSTLECADGPLYGYELARSQRVAGTILLWSCALGGARMPGDIGVAGWPTLLAQRGCNALIAAPGALPSEPAPDLAVEVHRGLAAGEPTDAVLVRLRALAGSDALAARAAAMLAVHGAG